MNQKQVFPMKSLILGHKRGENNRPKYNFNWFYGIAKSAMRGIFSISKLIFYIFLLSVCHSSAPDDSAEEETASTPKEGKVIREEILQEVPYMTPKPTGNVYLAEAFDDIDLFNKRWVKSQAKKDDTSEDIAKYDELEILFGYRKKLKPDAVPTIKTVLSEQTGVPKTRENKGEWSVEASENDSNNKDLGLVLKTKAKHHAISSKLYKPYVFKGKPFVLQYEVRFQNGQECGGAYIKLLTEDPKLHLEQFHDKVPYTIMFGPDKCGADSKLHFIFRHKNPKNGSIEEKHWKKTPNVPKLDDVFKDKKPHLFTLVITPDDQFEVKVDNQVVQRGNLLQEFLPPVNPPAEIDDPEDFKPKDWDDRPKISDPDDFKPDDWDEDAPKEIPDPKAEKPEGWLDNEDDTIPNPDAVKPADWDDEMDGEWEPPRIDNPACEKAPGCGKWTRKMIPNPEFKGKWKPAMVDNPNYKGVWKPGRIPNPDFFEDKKPYSMMPIGAIGLELWSMSDGILFDNIIISDSVSVVEKFAEDSFALKKEKADAETNIWDTILKKTNNHPYGMLVYIMYCTAPVMIFICYMWRRVVEERNVESQKKKNDDFEGHDNKVNREDEPEAEDVPEAEDEPEAEAEDDQNVEEPAEDEEEEEEEEEEDEEEQPEEDVRTTRTSPRRRKPRKDL
ncbi:Calnexin [Nymphon striatum]|nr:Calnexin [Nymphon striatum]